MRLPRFRLTVRQAMLIVLVVAALLGAFEAGRQWERSGQPGTVPLDLPPLGLSPRRSHKPYLPPEDGREAAGDESPPLDLLPPK